VQLSNEGDIYDIKVYKLGGGLQLVGNEITILDSCSVEYIRIVSGGPPPVMTVNIRKVARQQEVASVLISYLS